MAEELNTQPTVLAEEDARRFRWLVRNGTYLHWESDQVTGIDWTFTVPRIDDEDIDIRALIDTAMAIETPSPP